MSLTPNDLVKMLMALALLLVAAHVVGHLFVRLRQPAVIGEILGGLLLGPTVLSRLAPGVMGSLFPRSGVGASVLGAVSYLGLLLLMFVTGNELRFLATGDERKTVSAVTSLGLLVPFGAGILVAKVLHHADFSGPHGSPATFTIVFGIAIAVTSVPVISRIMMDLGILGTRLARVVLTVAVLEDLALYIALAVIIGIAQAKSGGAFGLPALLRVTSPNASSAYYVIASVLFFAVFLIAGTSIFQWLAGSRLNLLERHDPVAFRFVFLLLLGLCCLALGINPIFGALLAGVSARNPGVGHGEDATEEAGHPCSVLKRFSLAFFVPLYFATVGLQLDLSHHLNVVFFAWFFVLACAVKALSVWLGSRLAGEDRSMSMNLAVALNARGGPGIVLATVTFSAGIINEAFFTALVLLSIVTSQIAGLWLEREFVRKPLQRSAAGVTRGAGARRGQLETLAAADDGKEGARMMGQRS